MAESRKYRVSLCFMTFMDVEVDAVSASAAEILGRSPVEPRVKMDVGPVVHKVEHRVPVPGAPGEFRWEDAR